MVIEHDTWHADPTILFLSIHKKICCVAVLGFELRSSLPPKDGIRSAVVMGKGDAKPLHYTAVQLSLIPELIESLFDVEYAARRYAARR